MPIKSITIESPQESGAIYGGLIDSLRKYTEEDSPLALTWANTIKGILIREFDHVPETLDEIARGRQVNPWTDWEALKGQKPL